MLGTLAVRCDVRPAKPLISPMALASLADRTPVPAAEAAKDRSAPGKVSGRLKCAMDALIWEGKSRADAARRANMSEHSLYAALRKPHVKAYYLAELDVLRTSERARNIHTLAEVRDQTSNQMARVQAVKALEQIDGVEAQTGNRAALPGMQIVIVQAGPNPPHVVVEHDARVPSQIGNQPSD